MRNWSNEKIGDLMLTGLGVNELAANRYEGLLSLPGYTNNFREYVVKNSALSLKFHFIIAYILITHDLSLKLFPLSPLNLIMKYQPG